jgi:hypothetical protein
MSIMYGPPVHGTTTELQTYRGLVASLRDTFNLLMGPGGDISSLNLTSTTVSGLMAELQRLKDSGNASQKKTVSERWGRILTRVPRLLKQFRDVENNSFNQRMKRLKIFNAELFPLGGLENTLWQIGSTGDLNYLVYDHSG